MVGLAVGVQQPAVLADGDVVLCGLYLYYDNAVVCEDNIIDFGFSFLVCHIDIAEVPEEGAVDKGQRMGDLIFSAFAGHMDCDFLFDCLQPTDSGNEIGACGSAIPSGGTGNSGDNLIQSCGLVIQDQLAGEALELQQLLNVLFTGKTIAGENVGGLQGLLQFGCSHSSHK